MVGIAASKQFLDQDGYRLNVGIVLCNCHDEVFWARRVKHDGWQFPQGGVRQNETTDQALYRELFEEVGLRPAQVEVVARTRSWLRYDLPQQYRRSARATGFRGQKQMWYLLRLVGNDADVQLDCSRRPEFDDWCWVDFWLPLEQIVDFKRDVYKSALSEFAPLLFGD